MDKIALQFAVRTGTHLCCATIQGYLSGKLNYNLKVLMEMVKHRNIDVEIGFFNVLGSLLQDCPEHLVMLDTMHSDRDAS